MQLRRFPDRSSFLSAAQAFLTRAEVENIVLLSVAGPPGTPPLVLSEDCYLAVVEDRGEVVACAVRLWPDRVLISRGEQEALECLVNDLAAKYTTLHQDLMRIVREHALVVTALWLWVAGLSGCARTTASGASAHIPIEVQKPAGAGPFPAVVIAHDCSGLGTPSSGAPWRWAGELVAKGYVALIPDSFSTRGFPAGVCTDARPGRDTVNPAHRARDAYAALAQLILIGEKDDWTPAPSCQALADAARGAGHPVSIKIYPGAHHSFDSPHPIRFVAARINANALGGRGATTGGDPAAWADAIREVLAFFGQHLRS